jgi:7-carboxy-7-deazaguanine synthase
MNLSEAYHSDGRSLPVVEEFYTIQGEGFHMGKPAYFLRIGGCDVGCQWCDTKFSWNPELHPVVDTDTIVENILQCPAKAVVITGGEPLIYNLNYLCKRLKDSGVETFLETSGSHELSGEWDWICLSPKINMAPLPSIFKYADELKVIISKESDLKWALLNAGQVRKDCKLYLQPEWSVSQQIMPFIVGFVKEQPRWNISLQAHKYMRIP